MNMPNLYEELAQRVPSAMRAKVIENVNKTYRVLNIPEETLNFLFDMWEGHIKNWTDPLDRNCRACRTEVINKMRQITFVLEQMEQAQEQNKAE